MRLCLVFLLCLVIVVVNTATTKIPRSRLPTTIGRNNTKASSSKSAFAYLRTIRGKNSCAGGSCPFWDRHGRSFASLRCYSRQYQECTCLHRMCFSSCMFTREICNQEMASCLRQICPLCMPASATTMCAVYDSMAERVADALSFFACYPCCPNTNGAASNNSSKVYLRNSLRIDSLLYFADAGSATITTTCKTLLFDFIREFITHIIFLTLNSNATGLFNTIFFQPSGRLAPT